MAHTVVIGSSKVRMCCTGLCPRAHVYLYLHVSTCIADIVHAYNLCPCAFLLACVYWLDSTPTLSVGVWVGGRVYVFVRVCLHALLPMSCTNHVLHIPTMFFSGYQDNIDVARILYFKGWPFFLVARTTR